MELNRSKGALPLYIQIQNILKEKIENDQYTYGDILPSETQLQELYGVSRMTIRQAVGNLVNDGDLQCLRGIGTKVIFEKIDENIKQVISFSDEMARHGIKMETKECSMSLVKADKYVASQLEIPTGGQVYKLVRIRTVKGSPLVYSITHLTKKYDLPLDVCAYRDSLYAFLFDEYQVKIVKGQDTIEAILANNEIAQCLNIPVGSAVFKRRRKTFDQHEHVIEYTICFYPGDKYKYTVEL